jgi:hypothetical protein
MRPVRNSHAGDDIVEFAAVTAVDGLDKNADPAIGPAGDLDAVAALWTFKPIRSAHANSRSFARREIFVSFRPEFKLFRAICRVVFKSGQITGL